MYRISRSMRDGTMRWGGQLIPSVFFSRLFTVCHSIHSEWNELLITTGILVSVVISRIIIIAGGVALYSIFFFRFHRTTLFFTATAVKCAKIFFK